MTPAQRAILNALRDLSGPLGPPSCQEIADHVGARSKGGVWMNLRRLQAMGLVEQRRRRFLLKATHAE